MRTKDRLHELRPAGEDVEAAGAEWRGVYGDTTEPLGEHLAPPHYKDIDALLQEVERTRGWILEMERNTQLVRRLHTDPTFHTNRQLQEQLDAAVTQSNAAGLKVCGALRQLEARCAAGTGVDVVGRVARLQSAVSRRQYADALAAHHRALAALRDDQLQLLRAQVKLTNLTLSDDECQSLLDTDNIALFVGNVRAETAEARRALRDVEARHEELVRVESSLRAVRDLFTQLAHLVALQQEQVDSVEYYAQQAGSLVDRGQHQLLKGSVSHARSHRKKISIIICLAAGFVIVLLVLIVT